MLDLSPELEILQIGALFVLTVSAFHSGVALSRGSRYSVHYLVLVYFFLYGIPLAMDTTIGIPDYKIYPGFYAAANENSTRLVYCTTVMIPPVLWLVWGRPRKTGSGGVVVVNEFLKGGMFLWMAIAMISLPVAVLLVAPHKSVYMEYGAALKLSLLDPQVQGYHGYVSVSSMFGVLGVVGLFLRFDKVGWFRGVLLFILVVLFCWINGKRMIIAMCLLAGFLVYRQKRSVAGRREYLVGFIVLLVAVAGNYYYQSTIRFINPNHVVRHGLYDSYRVDYCRDRSLMLAVHKEVEVNERPILEFRGQSLLFYGTMYVPRSLWVDKPLPYSQYFMSAVYGGRPATWTWTVTTSIIDEAVANFGLIGVFVGAGLLLALCRVGDAEKSNAPIGLTVLVCALFLTVQLSAFVPVLLLWLLVVAASWYKNIVHYSG